MLKWTFKPLARVRKCWSEEAIDVWEISKPLEFLAIDPHNF
jgi:hypothetical protein